MRLFGRRDTSRQVPERDVGLGDQHRDLIWEDDEIVIDLRSEPTGDCRNCGGTMRIDHVDTIANLHVLTCPECGFRHTIRARDG